MPKIPQKQYDFRVTTRNELVNFPIKDGGDQVIYCEELQTLYRLMAWADYQEKITPHGDEIILHSVDSAYVFIAVGGKYDVYRSIEQPFTVYVAFGGDDNRTGLPGQAKKTLSFFEKLPPIINAEINITSGQHYFERDYVDRFTSMEDGKPYLLKLKGFRGKGSISIGLDGLNAPYADVAEHALKFVYNDQAQPWFDYRIDLETDDDWATYDFSNKLMWIVPYHGLNADSMKRPVLRYKNSPYLMVPDVYRFQGTDQGASTEFLGLRFNKIDARAIISTDNDTPVLIEDVDIEVKFREANIYTNGDQRIVFRNVKKLDIYHAGFMTGNLVVENVKDFSFMRSQLRNYNNSSNYNLFRNIEEGIFYLSFMAGENYAVLADIENSSLRFDRFFFVSSPLAIKAKKSEIELRNTNFVDCQKIFQTEKSVIKFATSGQVDGFYSRIEVQEIDTSVERNFMEADGTEIAVSDTFFNMESYVFIDDIPQREVIWGSSIKSDIEKILNREEENNVTNYMGGNKLRYYGAAGGKYYPEVEYKDKWQLGAVYDRYEQEKYDPTFRNVISNLEVGFATTYSIIFYPPQRANSGNLGNSFNAYSTFQYSDGSHDKNMFARMRIEFLEYDKDNNAIVKHLTGLSFNDWNSLLSWLPSVTTFDSATGNNKYYLVLRAYYYEDKSQTELTSVGINMFMSLVRGWGRYRRRFKTLPPSVEWDGYVSWIRDVANRVWGISNANVSDMAETIWLPVSRWDMFFTVQATANSYTIQLPSGNDNEYDNNRNVWDDWNNVFIKRPLDNYIFMRDGSFGVTRSIFYRVDEQGNWHYNGKNTYDDSWGVYKDSEVMLVTMRSDKNSNYKALRLFPGGVDTFYVRINPVLLPIKNELIPVVEFSQGGKTTFIRQIDTKPFLDKTYRLTTLYKTNKDALYAAMGVTIPLFANKDFWVYPRFRFGAYHPKTGKMYWASEFYRFVNNHRGVARQILPIMNGR